jgi:hypothetical protein
MTYERRYEYRNARVFAKARLALHFEFTGTGNESKKNGKQQGLGVSIILHHRARFESHEWVGCICYC